MINQSYIITLIQNFAKAYEGFTKPISHEFKIPQTSLEILLFLANNPNLHTASDIVKYRRLKANIVSFNVEKLVSEGYLIRKPIEGDRRKICLVCTEKADPIIERELSLRKTFLASIFEGLTPEDLERLKYYHTVIYNNLNKTVNDITQDEQEQYN